VYCLIRSSQSGWDSDSDCTGSLVDPLGRMINFGQSIRTSCCNAVARWPQESIARVDLGASTSLTAKWFVGGQMFAWHSLCAILSPTFVTLCLAWSAAQ
jgi:hypothetical protein